MAQRGKNLPAAGDIGNVGSIYGSGRSLEEEIATYPSIYLHTYFVSHVNKLMEDLGPY